MGIYSEEIVDACIKFEYGCAVLESDMARSVRSAVEAKFAKYEGPDPLWERLDLTAGIHDENGWVRIENFTNGDSIFIFFDTYRDRDVVSLENSFNLTKILAECTGFVFYITDKTYEYLICFNDHDILIGAGKAEKWISTLNEGG